MDLSWIDIVVPAGCSLIGALFGGGAIYWKENKKAKQIDNKAHEIEKKGIVRVLNGILTLQTPPVYPTAGKVVIADGVVDGVEGVHIAIPCLLSLQEKLSRFSIITFGIGFYLQLLLLRFS